MDNLKKKIEGLEKLTLEKQNEKERLKDET